MKKVLSIIKNILVILIVIATVGIMIFTIASSATFDRNDRNIFGFKFFVVQTDSMSATDFSAGDVIISKEVDPLDAEGRRYHHIHLTESRQLRRNRHP